jgi:mannose-1-phosphate guanylyltransferase
MHPATPETGHGYIEPGGALHAAPGVFAVPRFI